MKPKYTVAVILIVALSVCFPSHVFTYVVSGDSWPEATATLYSRGSSDSQWNDAFVESMQLWNLLPNFTYVDIDGYADPCANPFIDGGGTGWAFRYDNCGATFGRSTLAVNLNWSVGGRIIQAGTVFNANQLWDVHHGPSPVYYDFRRVAAHELGHALGLKHEDNHTALMNPFYSNSVETLQADDINGLEAIYPTPRSATAPVPVYRFWNRNSGHHFFTISSDEKNSLICCDPDMVYEGIAWYALAGQDPNTVPVYRFYDANLGAHFYTTDEAEKNQRICCDPDWNFEGVAWYLYPDQQPNSIPVYRFYNSDRAGHFYTSGESEKNHLICCDPGWRYEGIVFYALPP